MRERTDLKKGLERVGAILVEVQDVFNAFTNPEVATTEMIQHAERAYVLLEKARRDLEELREELEGKCSLKAEC